MTDPQFILDVLRLFAEHDMQDQLFWRVDEKTVSFFVNCNDLFFWACSDAEPITPETLPVLRQAIADCVAVDPMQPEEGLTLYACRQRRMRPQGCCYPEEKFWSLIDTCGPERVMGLGNPYRPVKHE